MTSQQRGFSGTFGVFAATLGSAVGLGNLWMFPFLVGVNGGASFVFVYLLATLLVGLPVMIAETMLGRTARSDAVSVFEKLAPTGVRIWKIIGYLSLASVVLLMAFYSEVVGWVYAYIFKSITGTISTTHPDVARATFNSFVSSPVEAVLWQWGALIVTGLIIMMGVTKGIEAVTRKLIPILFFLLIILCVRSLTLPGAKEGLLFLFKPDFSAINAKMVLTALGLAFFKLSLGMGCMLTYGSYFRSEQNIPRTAVQVMLADLLVSMLAGMAIFPAVFAFGFRPADGPSLVFMTIPAVFSSMPGGFIFMALFFVLTAIAATGAILSQFEVPVAVLTERCGWKRKQASLFVVVGAALLGLPAALSNSLTAHITVLGLNFFDLFDFLTMRILMPISGLLVCIFTAFVFGRERYRAELSNQGLLSNGKLSCLMFEFTRFVAPVLILVVLLHGLGAFKYLF